MHAAWTQQRFDDHPFIRFGRSANASGADFRFCLHAQQARAPGAHEPTQTASRGAYASQGGGRGPIPARLSTVGKFVAATAASGHEPKFGNDGSRAPKGRLTFAI